MVKPGSNLCQKKLEKKSLLDDGFDNIPLITPLEVNQLQNPHATPDQVTTPAGDGSVCVCVCVCRCVCVCACLFF